MPPVVAAATALVAKFSFTNFVIGTALSMAVSFAVNAVFGGAPEPPDLPNFTSEARDRKHLIRSSISPRRYVYGKPRLSGTLVYATSTGSKNKYLHMVVALCEGPVSSIGQVYLNDEPVGTLDGSGNVTTGRFKDKVRIKKHLGASDQAADSDLVSESGNWTSNHRLRGVAYLYVRLEFDRDVFPTGIPKPSAIVEGSTEIFDPRDDTTGYSTNAALCIRHYMLSAYGLNCSADEIDDTEAIAAANICDEDVTIASGTQKRYTLNGVIKTDKAPIEVMEKMLTSCAGHIVYQQGKYRILPGAYRSPAITLNEDNLRGPVKVRPNVSRSNLFNRVRGTFINPDKYYEADDFAPVENSLYESQDGEQITKEITLPFTTDAVMAQRIAKIQLEKARQGATVEFPANYSALECEVLQPLYLSIDRLGYDNKVFLPVDWKFSAAGGIDLVLQEEAAGVYAWNSGEATTYDLAPDTELPSPFDPPAPSDVTLDSGTDQLFISGDGTVQSRLKVAWTAPDDATVISYDLEWRKDGDAEFTRVVLPGETTQFMIAPVKDGTTYEVRIRAINIRSVRSDYVTKTHVIVGKTARPDGVSSFFVDRQPDGTRRFTWDLSNAEPDVRVGGGYKIRYAAGGALDWDNDTPLHAGLLIASPYETNELAAGTYTFGIKAVDSSGNESENALTATVTLGDPRLRNVLVARNEHTLGWPGTKTDCFANPEGKLEATGSETWADLPGTWDALSGTWREIVANNSPIAYETPVIDIGADVDFTPLVTVEAEGSVTIEMKTGTDADGDVTGSYVATEPVKSKRYVQLKITVTGTAPLVHTMTTLLDGETVLDEFENINTASESASWFERIAAGHFKIADRKGMAAVSSAQIRALQNVGSGYSWELISKTASVTGNTNPAAEFKIYNASGTLTDATADVELKGPKAT